MIFFHTDDVSHTHADTMFERETTPYSVSHETHIHLYKSRKVCWICDFKAKSEKGIVIG